MTDRPDRVFLCSCEGTMPLDAAAVAKGLARDLPGAALETGRQFCGAESGRVAAALAAGERIVIGCTQEQPRFEELAEDAGHDAPRAYACLRETAGWAREAAAAGPKMAALLVAAAVPAPPIRLAPLESRGVLLVLGAGDVAVEAGAALAEHLDVTVLLEPGAEAAPPRATVFPVLQGRVRRAAGHLGAYNVTVDAFAAARPSSRHRLDFGAATDGATSEADIVLDLRGRAALFPGDGLRPGYLRADPGDPAAVARAVMAASHLVGTFDKPRYVDFDAGLCAHSRSRITGCTRCLDVCPAGAISSAGDSVTIDPAICAGCGQCASVCPTGAAAYALPPVDTLLARLRALLRGYAAAGGRDAVVLIHDIGHGAALVDALGRFGPGLPARVLPLAVNEATQVAPETLAAALAYGAAAVRVLVRARPRRDIAALAAALELTRTAALALGHPAEALEVVETDDPDALADALAALPRGGAASASAFLPVGAKRGLLETAFRELHRTAPSPVDTIPLAAGAPFGAALVDPDACTLCLACVSACPTAALADNPDRPMLRFTESLCVQCGLCAATCPEDAITLAPRIDIPAWDAPRRVVKEEEPFHCAECGKAFGTRASIERVKARLAGHWMYSGPQGEARRRVLELCEDCRVSAVVSESFDPHAAETRTVRTTDDYFAGRKRPS